MRQSRALMIMSGLTSHSEDSGDRNEVRCQVPGCEGQLEKAYYKRCKVCPQHARQSSILLGGKLVRFCKLCRRFHDVSDFEGDRRNCRKMLSIHNTRRRERKLKSPAAARVVAPGMQAGLDTSDIASSDNRSHSNPTSIAQQQAFSGPLSPSPFQQLCQVPLEAAGPTAGQLQPAQSALASLDMANSMAATDGSLFEFPSMELPSLTSSELEEMLTWLPGLISETTPLPATSTPTAVPAANTPPASPTVQRTADNKLNQMPAATKMQSPGLSCTFWPGIQAQTPQAVSSQALCSSLLPEGTPPASVFSGVPVMQPKPDQTCSSQAGSSTLQCDFVAAWLAQLPSIQPATSNPNSFEHNTCQPMGSHHFPTPTHQEAMPNGSSIEVMLNGIHIKLPERVQQNIMGLLANELDFGLHGLIPKL